VQTQKRSWIYSGLAHPRGVVLARSERPRRRLRSGSSLLLCGDEHAWGLRPFLGHLCRDGGVSFSARAHRCTLEDWADSAGLRAAVAEFEPTVVVMSLGLCGAPSEKTAATVRDIAAAARSSRGTLVWLRPPERSAAGAGLRQQLDHAKVPSFHSDALELPRGPDGKLPTARGYAGWAGALWRWIG